MAIFLCIRYLVPWLCIMEIYLMSWRGLLESVASFEANMVIGTGCASVV